MRDETYEIEPDPRLEAPGDRYARSLSVVVWAPLLGQRVIHPLGGAQRGDGTRLFISHVLRQIGWKFQRRYSNGTRISMVSDGWRWKWSRFWGDASLWVTRVGRRVPADYDFDADSVDARLGKFLSK